MMKVFYKDRELGNVSSITTTDDYESYLVEDDNRLYGVCRTEIILNKTKINNLDYFLKHYNDELEFLQLDDDLHTIFKGTIVSFTDDVLIEASGWELVLEKEKILKRSK